MGLLGEVEREKERWIKKEEGERKREKERES